MVTPSRSWTKATVCSLTAALWLSVLCGCSPSDTAQVSGKVRYQDGSHLEEPYRFIQFVPADTTTATIRKAASSQIKDDGSFNLYTRMPGDGVYKGDYKVTFTVQKSAFDELPLIPEKYLLPGTTPFSVTIDRDQDDMLFELE